MQNTFAWSNRKSEISVSTKQFGALKKGIKPGFFSWTEDHRGRKVLPQASVRGGTKFFSSGYFGQKRKKEKNRAPLGNYAEFVYLLLETRLGLKPNVHWKRT